MQILSSSQLINFNKHFAPIGRLFAIETIVDDSIRTARERICLSRGSLDIVQFISYTRYRNYSITLL